jgi:basic membrane protein A
MREKWQMSALLGKDTELQGKLKCDGTLMVEGRFNGDITTNGTLIVGKDAKIESKIKVSSIIVSGYIKGNIKADKRIEIHPPAKVFGNLRAPSVIIEEGVVFEGRTKMERTITSLASKPYKLKVALVVSGNLGDRFYYDLGNDGILKASKELKVKSKVFECWGDPDAFFPQLLTAARNYDVVFTMGSKLVGPLQKIAIQFPENKFIHIDGSVSGPPNMGSILYKDNEIAFLAGALAAMMAKKQKDPIIRGRNIIGAVCGERNSLTRKFMAGYEAGAKHIDRAIRLHIEYIGSLNDPEKAKRKANKIYKKGADIIFQVAGRSGAGILEAARESKFYVISGDADVAKAIPEFVIGTIMKPIDSSIFETIQLILHDKYKDGTVKEYGISKDGMGMEMNVIKGEIIGQGVMTRLGQIEKDVMNGKIMIPEA